jgi:transmembrane sensor
MEEASSQDRNQRLARRIGELRAKGSGLESLSASDDELAQVLFAYRQEIVDAGAEPAPETSRRLWEGIASELEVPNAARTEGDQRRSEYPSRRDDRSAVPAGRRSRVWRTAIGAGLLLVVGLAVWLLWPRAEAGLVAEAATDIVTYETRAGDVVRLRPHSRLYRTSDDASRFRLEGEAVFDVTPRSNAPFAVEANGAVVRVLGTRFTVQTWTPRPTVFLEEGRVALQNIATGETAALRPGEAATVTAKGSVAVQSATPDAFVDWLDGQITFDSQSAGKVATELEQHYGLRVQLPDSVAAQVLTGRLLLDEPAQALEDFGRVLGGQFKRSGETFRFRPD